MKKETTSRQANMELLRIVAMLMIITLHYLDNGKILGSFAEIGSINAYLAWGLEAFAIVAVNLYVLISGYFLCESKFTFRKVIILWVQVLFYSWVIGAICLLGGWAPDEARTLYGLIFIAFPITSGHYWFATVYLLLFASFPFLNVGIRNMNRSQHKACIIVLVVIFSLWKTVLPFTIPLTDLEGMDLPWFVVIYMIAAYLRKYPDNRVMQKKGSWLGYILCSLLMFGFGILLNFVQLKTGKLGGYATTLYSYNSLANVAGSVFLFAAFTRIKIPDGFWSRAIIRIAGCTFGVYLIHEHRYLRYIWPKLLHVPGSATKATMLLQLVGAVLLLFTICTLIEWLRQLLFGLVWRSKWFGKLTGCFAKAEDRINGN